MNRRKKGRLNWNMFRLLVICWILPLTLITAGLMYLSASKNRNQMEKTIQTSAVKAVDSFESTIQMAMTASRNTSYMGVVKECYLNYKQDGDRQKLYTDITLFLNQQYRYNETIASTMLFLLEEPDRVFYTYSTAAGATYSNVRQFKQNAYDKVMECASSIKNALRYIQVDGRLYIVRNLLLSDFTPYAVLVMEVNMDALLGNFQTILWYVDGTCYLDGSEICSDMERINKASAEMSQRPTGEPLTAPKGIVYSDGSYYDSRASKIYLKVPVENQVFQFTIQLDHAAISYEQDLVLYIFALILIFTIPLIILLFHFFFVNVTKPIRRLIKASHDIEDGNFGVQIYEQPSNTEFTYLVDTFNSMSLKLKNLFGKIYLEEIALRDANIQALQSQINPHFMNNTLEIINWEARMAGNENVSRMIEALSVMLEATMDRKKQHLILLSEELSYVDAYLYIIGRRFGQLFHFTKEIDETLLEVYVPRLIIQPIIENAVEHGTDKSGYRNIFLHIYQDNTSILLEVINNGIMTKDDLEKIDKLLNNGPQEAEKAKNLGISNVNKRLKIIYGENSGLTIRIGESNEVISCITINKKEVSQQYPINDNCNH